MPNVLEQECDTDVRVECEKRRICEGRFDRQTLIQEVREALDDAKVQVDITREHVTTFDSETCFHVRRNECVGALVVVSRNNAAVGFGTEFRVAHQLETEVKACGCKKIVLFERVAEHDWKFKQHNVELGLVRINVHVFFVIVLTVVERQFRNEAEVLREHGNLDDKACTYVPSCAPTVGMGSQKRVETALNACAHKDGLRKSFLALSADFGSRSRLCFVPGVCVCVVLVVCKFAVV